MPRTIRQSLLAGLTGTAAMTATMQLEKAARSEDALPVDYDATDHVVTAAATVLRWTPRTDRERGALFNLVHWGYGSAVAVGYRLLRRAGVRPVPATAIFYLTCQSMAFVMFPVLGGTPPPWRWRRDVLASSLAQHAVFAVTVAAVDHAVERSV